MQPTLTNAMSGLRTLQRATLHGQRAGEEAELLAGRSDDLRSAAVATDIVHPDLGGR